MAWTKINPALIAAACLVALLAGCATWSSIPNYPTGPSQSDQSSQQDHASRLVDIEANRLTSEANLIAYKQGIAASIGAFTGILTLLSAIAAAIYAKQAAAQSRRSADIAQNALVAGERAWLSVQVTPEGPLHFLPHGGLSTEIGIHIKNVGKTPALNVHTDVDEIRLALTFPPERAGEFAKAKRVVNTTSSRLLLPGQEYTRAWVPSAEEATDELPLFPVIIGCVTYQISPDQTLHQTAFSLMLTRVDDAGSLLFRHGTEIPSDELEFIHIAGAFAD